jgi:hypothetical protein
LRERSSRIIEEEAIEERMRSPDSADIGRFELPIAVTLAAVQVAMAVAQVALIQAGRAHGAFPGSSLPGDVAGAAGIVATLAVGSFIIARRPGNLIGWLFVLSNLGWGVNNLAAAYVEYATTAGPLPAASVAAWLTTWPSGSSLPMLALLILVFPDGRAPSRRWRRFGAVLVGWAIVDSLIMGFAPGPTQALAMKGLPVRNPLGLGGLPGAVLAGIADPAPMVNIALVAGAAVSLVRRFLRSRGLERQQLKWLAYAVMVIVVVWLSSVPIMAAYPSLAQAPDWARLWNALVIDAYVLLPAAAAVAILRYRLYEIDRIISRTVSYAVVTGLLAALFVGTVLALQGLLAQSTAGNGLAVAGSTLVVAASFQPLRRRVQRAVDRRFNRARYDAERILADFAAHVRDDVELQALVDEIVRVTGLTVAPALAAVWLRGAPGGPRLGVGEGRA